MQQGSPAFAHLPGHELVSDGVADLAQGRLTVPAFLVASFAVRLRELGVAVPDVAVTEPEHALYRELARDDPDSAHSRYNALVGRLVSFAEAAECAS